MIQPLDQYVVVQIPEHKMEKQHGILVAIEKKSGSTSEGTVLAAGPGKRLENETSREMLVKAGDVVLIPNNAGFPTKLNDKDCIVLKEDDIIGIIE